MRPSVLYALAVSLLAQSALAAPVSSTTQGNFFQQYLESVAENFGRQTQQETTLSTAVTSLTARTYTEPAPTLDSHQSQLPFALANESDNPSADSPDSTATDANSPEDSPQSTASPDTSITHTNSPDDSPQSTDSPESVTSSPDTFDAQQNVQNSEDRESPLLASSQDDEPALSKPTQQPAASTPSESTQIGRAHV